MGVLYGSQAAPHLERNAGEFVLVVPERDPQARGKLTKSHHHPLTTRDLQHLAGSVQRALHDQPEGLDGAEAAQLHDDWTRVEGRSNSSPMYHELVAIVAGMIRSGAHSLIAGRAEDVAGVIVAGLVHEHGIGAPRYGVAGLPRKEFTGGDT